MNFRRVDDFNERIAEIVSRLTGNMWFFWASLVFILILRFSHPPSVSELLLNFENDLQLLLLAANAVVGSNQMKMLIQILKNIEEEGKHIEKVVATLDIKDNVPNE